MSWLDPGETNSRLIIRIHGKDMMEMGMKKEVTDEKQEI